ncbi:MAG: hypothetical protein ACJAXJ_003634 [Colwellia sp.]|jgi:uncharacterized protein (TIGR03545 family)
MSTNNVGAAKSMKNYVRFSGLISFFVVTLLVVFLLYLFAETLVKSTIEQVGGTMIGAEVNVASVDLEYSPLMLTINNLEVTDAEQPSHNLFSVKQSKAGIDLWQFLLGKTIIEQLDVVKLELMTQRSHVGDVYGKKQSDEQQPLVVESLLPAMDLQLPDVKSILDDSNLLTVKAAEQLQTSYDEEKLKLNALKEKLPSKAKLAAYKLKIKNISKMKVKNLDDFNKVKTEFDNIKKDFNDDQAIVKAAKAQFLSSKQRLVKNVSALKNAPKQDWQTIESKYQLETVNTEDFAHILFGEQARGYYQKAEKLYQRIAPFLNSDNKVNEDTQANLNAQGRFIHFDENSPLPEFLVKNAKLSMVLAQGDFEITAKELTHQHWYRNNPSTVHINSTKLTHGGDVTMDSQFERAKNGDLSGEGQWLIKQFALQNMQLTDVKSLALTLIEGKLSGSGDFAVNQNNDTGSTHTKSSNIVSNSHFVLANASYQGEADNKFAGILLDTFKSLDELTLNVNVVGDVEQPKFNMSSSLDKAVKGAFKKQIANKLIEFKTQVNSGLNEKLAQSLQLSNENDTELVNFEALLGDTNNALEQLKNSDVVKQQKKKLQDKAKDKLKSKLSDLFG